MLSLSGDRGFSSESCANSPQFGRAALKTLRPSLSPGTDGSNLPSSSGESSANHKTTGRSDDDLPVHSFRTLLNDLVTLTRNTLVTAIAPEQRCETCRRLDPVMRRRRSAPP